MTDRTKKWLNIALLVAFPSLMFFSPYDSDDVPKWRLRVVDEKGQPVAEAQVVQEWSHPVVKDKIVRVYDVTDRDGWATFPPGGVRASFMRRAVIYVFSKSAGPSAPRVIACWHDKTGGLFWENVRGEPEHRLVLHAGSCPLASTR